VHSNYFVSTIFVTEQVKDALERSGFNNFELIPFSQIKQEAIAAFQMQNQARQARDERANQESAYLWQRFEEWKRQQAES
jgi:hypothetical protein